MNRWQSIFSAAYWRQTGRVRRALVLGALLVAVVAVSGCQTFSFYGQAIKGQYQIFAHEQKVPLLLADTNTPPKLKVKLELLEALRGFADKELKLPVDGH